MMALITRGVCEPASFSQKALSLSAYGEPVKQKDASLCGFKTAGRGRLDQWLAKGEIGPGRHLFH